MEEKSLEDSRKMETAGFWLERLAPEQRNKLLTPAEEIRALNHAAFQRESCEMHDIFGLEDLGSEGSLAEKAVRKLEKEKARAQEYLRDMFQLPRIAEKFSRQRQEIEDAVLKAEALEKPFIRGIANGPVPVTFLPVDPGAASERGIPAEPEEPGKPADPGERVDELYLTELAAGEPFIGYFQSSNKLYLWIHNFCVSGWIYIDQVSLFDSAEEWREAAGEVFRHHLFHPVSDHRSLPQPALPWPAQRHSVPAQPAPLTPENLLTELFRNYGAGYRFGSRTDCTGYVRTVYERFGFLLPSNSVKQPLYPGRRYDLEGLPDEEKVRILKELPLGTLLYMPMHAMVWLGEADGTLYIINAVSSFYDDEGRLHRPRRIMVNPLDVRRKDGETWLNSLTAALIPWEKD